MKISEAIILSEKALRKAECNLQHAADKPNTTPVEIENLKKKLEYAEIVCAALAAQTDEGFKEVV